MILFLDVVVLCGLDYQAMTEYGGQVFNLPADGILDGK
jgi:hypothetical protein